MDVEKMYTEYANLYHMKQELLKWIRKNMNNLYSEIYLDKCCEQYVAMELYCTALKYRIELIKHDEHIR